MSNPWFRMYHEFADDPKVQRLSEVDQRRFIMLLCIRCRNGDETLQDEDVTFTLRITDDEWLKTKATLRDKNLIDSDNRPIAWDKRQYKSDSSTERVSKHREKKKQDETLQKRSGNVLEQNRTDTEQIQNQNRTEQKKPSARGSRLPKEWMLPKSWGEWAMHEKPEWSVDDVRKCSEKFRDYWISVSGSKGTKLDWEATWRNWVRSSANDVKKTSSYNAKFEAQQDFMNQLWGRKNGTNRPPIDITPQRSVESCGENLSKALPGVRQSGDE